LFVPFGWIFGVLAFGVFCGGAGLRLLVHPQLETKLVGLFLALLGGALAVGLLMRRGWARWGGILVAALVAAFSLRLVVAHGEALHHAMLFVSIATAGLLLIPASGDPRRYAAESVGGPANTVGAVGWTALVSFVGLLALVWGSDTALVVENRSADLSLPAAAIGKSIRWTNFDAGMERARGEDKPVLATFVTDWCPYCSKMTTKTWRASAVAERLEELVAVRVDVEEASGAGGTPGAALAARYGVHGYPVQLLLDPEGRVVSRFDGFQSAPQLLAWLDDALTARTAADSTPSRRSPGS
jgi:thiol-disulfide isomerase/thioredoxin